LMWRTIAGQALRLLGAVRPAYSSI
jgi:hypothetical protein